MNETAKTAPCGSGMCPLSLLSPDSLARLLKPPFRRRHPVLFWLGLIASCLVVLTAAGFLSEEDDEGGDRIALVAITGAINNVEPNLEWIRRISLNPQVKGVLVRVDSPGGGASASQELYAALAELAKQKPMVVSMGATAASGGLMISMAAPRVFANAATLTGSIGVRMDIPQLQGLMAKLGVGQETLVSGPYKDAASLTKPMTPEDRRYLQELVMQLHGQFVDIVAKGRKMPREKVLALANGKAYTGQEALELGLVDALGGQETALAWLAEKTGIPIQRSLLKRKVSKTRLVEKLLDTEQNATLTKILQWITESMGASAGQDREPRPLLLYQM